MQNQWSQLEVEAVVADYLQMLVLELQGIAFNKAERNRSLRQLLTNRTAGSVERKHQNISAVLLEMGYPYVDGYKPLANYQELLVETVWRHLEQLTSLDRTLLESVQAPAHNLPMEEDVLLMRVETPGRRNRPTSLYEEGRTATPKPVRRNFLELESRNQSLGLAGEKMILEYEHKRLWSLGERRLAEKVEHVSVTQGDGLGYDILSFEPNGQEKLIEVKTTRFGPWTPFFASRNEVRVSEEQDASYRVCRVFAYGKKPRFFTLEGSMGKTCLLQPTQYAAVPK